MKCRGEAGHTAFTWVSTWVVWVSTTFADVSNSRFYVSTSRPFPSFFDVFCIYQDSDSGDYFPIVSSHTKLGWRLMLNKTANLFQIFFGWKSGYLIYPKKGLLGDFSLMGDQFKSRWAGNWKSINQNVGNLLLQIVFSFFLLLEMMSFQHTVIGCPDPCIAKPHINNFVWCINQG